MNIIINQDSRDFMCAEDYPVAERIINRYASDSRTAEDFAKLAINAMVIGERRDRVECVEVYKAQASIAMNGMRWNFYGDSRDVDVWIRAVAKVKDRSGQEAMLDIGARLSDILSLHGGDELRCWHVLYFPNEI